MRWKCVCLFDGIGFKGWQTQPEGGSVQDLLQSVLEKLLHKKIRIHGSSRTDAGVHARGMVFHFDVDWAYGEKRLKRAIQSALPGTIQLTKVTQVGDDFHARYSATGKRYRYFLYRGQADPFSVPYSWSAPPRLNVAEMVRAAGLLQGQHDFKAFSAWGGREMKTTVRDLRVLSIAEKGRKITITAEADGFLYKMVRSMVGALVNVGTGRLTPENIAEILASRKRTPLIRTAPPQGLFLEEVYY